MLPIFCVESWIEKFNRDQEKRENDLDVCETYQELSKAFSSLLFYFYLGVQLFCISVIFIGITNFINQDSKDTTQYLMFFGSLSTIGKKTHAQKNKYKVVSSQEDTFST